MSGRVASSVPILVQFEQGLNPGLFTLEADALTTTFLRQCWYGNRH